MTCPDLDTRGLCFGVRIFDSALSPETHSRLAGFIWSICNLLRGPYKRNEYRKVILPMTVLRRFDCLLAPTRARVLARHAKIESKPETVVRSVLRKVTGRLFYNLSRLDLPSTSMGRPALAHTAARPRIDPDVRR